MERSNPALQPTRLRAAAQEATAADGVMTLGGTVAKAFVLVLLTIASAGYTWYQYQLGNAQNLNVLLGVGFLGGFVVAMVAIFKPRTSPYTGPLYAVLEGMALGGVSAVINARYHGLPVLAVSLTLGVFVAMLALYVTRIIRATERTWAIVGTATLGIAVYYLIALVLGMFGVQAPLIQDSGPLGIAFSLFVVGIAAFNLILDFGLIEDGLQAGAPKYMEWYCAFGLLVTLAWLYLELLRLLRKLRR
ncbi:MAG TPA: Bax inhibitor-1/YccA family protein [Gemmatimonadaceae bacterium]|nr:Bax inhibitor-1/YccA family protein [Gemmatimonadaceae bacterium]